MSGPYSPQPQQRQDRSTRRDGNPINGNPISGERLFDEWRRDVNHQLDNVASILQQVQIGMERMNQQWSEHDRRLQALEAAPREQARERETWRGLSLQTLSTVGLFVGVLVAMLSPHITWH